MKLFTLFIFLVVPGNMCGQVKQLNELLKQYALNEFNWKKQPPIALQNSRELVVPEAASRETLQVIKWKDIDSAKIFDFSNGSVRVVIYGKVVKYQKCKTTDIGSIKYFDTVYSAATSADSVFIPLILKTHGKEPAFSNKIRKRFKKALYQLNNAPVAEYYNTVHTGQAVFYNRKTSEIIICYDCSSDKRLGKPTAKNLRNAKKLILNGLIYEEHSLVILSFELYIVKSGKAHHISNKGELLNDECLELIKKIKAGDSFIFDQIQVLVPDSSTRRIQAPGFIVK